MKSWIIVYLISWQGFVPSMSEENSKQLVDIRNLRAGIIENVGAFRITDSVLHEGIAAVPTVYRRGLTTTKTVDSNWRLGNQIIRNLAVLYTIGTAAFHTAVPSLYGRGLTPTWTACSNGLGNQLFKNLAVSFIAEKFDLRVDYSSHSLIKQLGIELYSGNHTWDHTIEVTDDNYFEILQKSSLSSNLNVNHGHAYFQTKDITNLIYNHLHKSTIQTNIIDKNPFKDRYKTNNDLCVHIRLGDVAHMNPGLRYYLKAIAHIAFDHLYIFTNEKSHLMIQKIIGIYPESIIPDYQEIETFQFASTCKNVLLSHGTFSSMIGYLSFFSKISYPEHDSTKKWYGDVDDIDGWNEITYLNVPVI